MSSLIASSSQVAAAEILRSDLALHHLFISLLSSPHSECVNHEPCHVQQVDEADQTTVVRAQHRQTEEA